MRFVDKQKAGRINSKLQLLADDTLDLLFNKASVVKDESGVNADKEKAQNLNTERLRLPWDFTSDNELFADDIKTETDLSQYQSENSDVRFSRSENLTRADYDRAKENGETELDFNQWKQVRSPEFKRWFGDWENDPDNASKVINPRTGEPLVVYHVTPNGRFNIFDIERQNAGKNLGKGVYLTKDRWRASQYATGENAHIIDGFVRIKNPIELQGNLTDAIANAIGDSKHLTVLLKQKGYNKTENAKRISAGKMTSQQSQQQYDEALRQILLDYDYDGITKEDVFVALTPNQIKSATDNNGEFSSENDDIRFSRKTPKQDTPYQRDLMVTHNISAKGIMHAKKMGGLPFASVAVAKQSNPLTGFGEVALIGDRDYIDPKGANKAEVYGTDIHSKRYEHDNEGTLDEVIAEMKAHYRRNSNNYDSSSLRNSVQKSTPQFESITDIQNNKSRLVSQEDYDAAFDALNNQAVDLARTLKMSYLDVLNNISALAHPDVEMAAELIEDIFPNADTLEKQKAVKNMLESLHNMPSTYFEGKAKVESGF